MVSSIENLKGLHANSTVFVLGSGYSLNFLKRSFFKDKLTIGVNETFRDWPCGYVLMHHHTHAQEAINAGNCVVLSEWDCGFKVKNERFTGKHNFKGDYYVYLTEENRLTPTVNINALLWNRPDELVISASTVGEAIHLAYHIGASSIVLCGVDGGCFDEGHWNYAGYNGGGKFDDGGGGTNPQHVLLTKRCMMAVVNEVRKRGVTVCSLNPFVDFELEGHEFISAETYFARKTADAK